MEGLSFDIDCVVLNILFNVIYICFHTFLLNYFVLRSMIVKRIPN